MNKAVKGNYDIPDFLKGQLIVSCQALRDEPLYGTKFMVMMAKAALIGGARGIRANSVEDIKAIKRQVNLPIIGIIKKEYIESECYITPTMKEVRHLVELAKPQIIAVDATDRIHPGGMNGSRFVAAVKKAYPDVLLMADISTYNEGVEAEAAGADFVSTTLSGYTANSRQIINPDFELMEQLSRDLKIPVVAEGRIWTPEEAKMAFKLGVFAVVVGAAITRPAEITKRFIDNGRM